MNESSEQFIESYEFATDSTLQQRVEEVKEYWAGRHLKDVVEEMPSPTIVPIDDMRDVALVEVMPDSGEVDQTRTLIMGLPYLNGLTPQHWIRAKTLQRLVAPAQRVWMVPNVIEGKPAYSFTERQKRQLSDGNILPLGEVQAQAFERLNGSANRLGAISVMGYSMGGLTALSLGAINSILSIQRVNADEVPSMQGRDAKQLRKDFMKSGGIGDLRSAIKDAEVPALSEAMNLPRLTRDLIRFGIASNKEDGKLMHQAMTGSAEDLVRRAIHKGVPVKLGRVAGSALFDPASVHINSDGLRIVDYEGNMFARKHASGDNVIAHAVMARDGLLK